MRAVETRLRQLVLLRNERRSLLDAGAVETQRAVVLISCCQNAGVLLISGQKCKSGQLCFTNLACRLSRHATNYYLFVPLWTFIGTVVIGCQPVVSECCDQARTGQFKESPGFAEGLFGSWVSSDIPHHLWWHALSQYREHTVAFSCRFVQGSRYIDAVLKCPQVQTRKQ